MVTVCLGVLAALGWPLRGPWGMLALGFALSSGADVLYLLLAARGTYVDGTLLDVVWPAAAVLTAAAAWQRPRPAPVRTGLSLLTVPALTTAVALLVLLADVVEVEVPAVAKLLAAGAVVASWCGPPSPSARSRSSPTPAGWRTPTTSPGCRTDGTSGPRSPAPSPGRPRVPAPRSPCCS